MKDEWKTGVNSCGPRHPEWDASPEKEAKACGPGMQPFERSKNPIQVNLFGEQIVTEEYTTTLISALVIRCTSVLCFLCFHMLSHAFTIVSFR